MSWPEVTIADRVLAGSVACVLGGVLGFIFANIFLPAQAPVSAVVYLVIALAALGFVAGFWKGDPAVRGLARIFRGL